MTRKSIALLHMKLYSRKAVNDLKVVLHSSHENNNINIQHGVENIIDYYSISQLSKISHNNHKTWSI